MRPEDSTRPESEKRKRTQKKSGSSRRGRPNAADAEAKAARLRDVAAEVFVEFGFEKATMNEIARRAGASKDTLYAQYSDKSDLYVGVMTGHLQRRLVPFSWLLSDKRSIDKVLNDFAFQVVTDVCGPGLDFIRLIYAESKCFPEVGKMFWEVGWLRGYSGIAGYFRKQIDRKRLVPRDPDLMARQFLNMLVGDSVTQALLYVQSSMSESLRRDAARVTVSSFLRMYGTRSEDRNR